MRAPGTLLKSAFLFVEPLSLAQASGSYSHAVTIDKKSRKPHHWYLKEVPDATIATREVVAQEFIRLFGLGPKTRLVDDMQGKYYVASKALPDFIPLSRPTAADVITQLRNQQLTGLGELSVLATVLGETDARNENSGSIPSGVGSQRHINKFDGDWCFAFLRRDHPPRVHHITEARIRTLPANNADATHNWFGLVEGGLDKNFGDPAYPTQRAIISVDMLTQDSIRQEINRTMLKVMLLPDQLIPQFVAHYVVDPAENQLLTETLLTRRNELQAAACYNKSFQAYMATTQAEEDVNAFIQQLNAFTLTKKQKLVQADEQAACAQQMHLQMTTLKQNIALLQGDISVIDAALARRPHLDNNNNTPLHLAVQSGNVELVRILAEKNPEDLLKLNKTGDTPLHLMATTGQQATLSFLLNECPSLRTQINFRNPISGQTPLLQAVAAGHLKIAEMLLSQGAKVDETDAQENSPLHLAVREGNVEMCALLVRNKAQVNTKNVDGNTPLHFAARSEHPNAKRIMEGLIRRGANVEAYNRKFETPAHFAAQSNNVLIKETLKLLQDKFYDFNKITIVGMKLPLIYAAQYGNKQVAEWLLTEGKANPDQTDMSGNTPLHYAVANKQNDLIPLFLAHQATVELPNDTGETLLHTAAHHNNPAAIPLLDINPNQMGQNGNTALHFAVEKNYSSVVTALLNRGADINLANRGGLTPMHIAAHLEHLETLHFLITRGANMEVFNLQGESLLYEMTKLQKLDVIFTLLQHGANPFLANQQTQETPVDWMIQNKRWDLVIEILSNTYSAQLIPATTLAHLSQHQPAIKQAVEDVFSSYNDEIKREAAAKLAANNALKELFPEIVQMIAPTPSAQRMTSTAATFSAFGTRPSAAAASAPLDAIPNDVTTTLESLKYALVHQQWAPAIGALMQLDSSSVIPPDIHGLMMNNWFALKNHLETHIGEDPDFVKIIAKLPTALTEFFPHILTNTMTSQASLTVVAAAAAPSSHRP